MEEMFVPLLSICLQHLIYWRYRKFRKLVDQMLNYSSSKKSLSNVVVYGMQRVSSCVFNGSWTLSTSKLYGSLEMKGLNALEIIKEC